MRTLTVCIPAGTALNESDRALTLTLYDPSLVALTVNSNVELSPASNSTVLLSTTAPSIVTLTKSLSDVVAGIVCVNFDAHGGADVGFVRSHKQVWIGLLLLVVGAGGLILNDPDRSPIFTV